MASTNTVSSQSDETTGAGMLRAQLAIEPHSDAGCVVANHDGDVGDVTQRRKVPRSHIEDQSENPGRSEQMGECHTEITNGGETVERSYFKSMVQEKCICPVFDEHDCIPEIKGVRSRSVIAVVTIRNRNVLQGLLSDLRAVGAHVSIEWLVRADGSESTVEIDVSNITTKQRETLETALEAGYYETPRETSLSDLAEELSVSESAVSQRLNAAETKLVKSYLEE